MRMLTNVLQLNLVFLFTTACSFIQDDVSDLDLPQDLRSKPIESKDVVRGTKVLEWQAFFKPPPSLEERKQLATNLDAWKESGSVEELLTRARHESALAQLTVAEGHLQEALRQAPEHPHALLDLAQVMLRQRRLEQALVVLANAREEIIDKKEQDSALVIRFRYLLARGLLLGDRTQEGRDVLVSLLAQYPKFAPGYALLSLTYISDDQYEAAEFIAQRGLDLAGDNAALANILGVVAQKAGSLDQAVQWYNRSLSISKDYAPALINRANIAILRAELDAARTDLEKAAAVDPRNHDALIALGVVQRSTGQLDEAENSLTRALQLEPESPLARFHLAVILLERQKNEDQSLQLFHEVLQLESASDEMKRVARSYLRGMRIAG